jgi:hypothetical protein
MLTPESLAYMLVSLGYPDEAIVEALPELGRDRALELAGMARTERASRLADQDAAIEVEREAARAGEWDTTTTGG